MASKSKAKRAVNYACELELKILLICTKNKSLGIGTLKHIDRLKELIGLYIRTETWKTIPRNLKFRKAIKKHAIWMAEHTVADDWMTSRLGEISTLMTTRILTKPQFSGYSYQDEFYSDALYKIFRYIKNFDHKKISAITGDSVNAFAYVTQIIHNSIIYVINYNKKHQDRIKTEYNHQRLKFLTEVPGLRINANMILDTVKEPEAEPVVVNLYYYNTHTFYDDLVADLERIDMNNVTEVRVVLPKGITHEDALIANFTEYNIVFDENKEV